MAVREEVVGLEERRGVAALHVEQRVLPARVVLHPRAEVVGLPVDVPVGWFEGGGVVVVREMYLVGGLNGGVWWLRRECDSVGRPVGLLVWWLRRE